MNWANAFVCYDECGILVLVHLAIVHVFYGLSCDEESPEITFSLRDFSAFCRSASCFFLATSKGNLS